MDRIIYFLLSFLLCVISVMWLIAEKSFEPLTSTILSFSYLVTSYTALVRVYDKPQKHKFLNKIKIKFYLPLLLLMPLLIIYLTNQNNIQYYNCILSDSMHKAANRGNYTFVKSCVDSGVDINILEKNKWTPLHSACKGGHIKIVELLLKSGANVNPKDKYGRSPLDHTFANNINLLLKSYGGIRYR